MKEKLFKIIIYIYFVLKMASSIYGADVSDYYQEVLEFDKEGNLMMTTHDKKADTAVKYRTIGWTIKRYDMPIDAPGQQYAIIVLHEYADIKYREDPNDSKYIYCYYYGDKDEIYQAIGKASKQWQDQLYKYGAEVYIDEIMTVYENEQALGGFTNKNGAYYGEVYFTYDGIARARPWASVESIKTHFDKRVEFFATILSPKNSDKSEIVDTMNYETVIDGSMKIGSNKSGDELFNVLLGIPTGEKLYISGRAREYYYKAVYKKVAGVKSVVVKVNTNYKLSWTDYYGKKQTQNKTVSRWYVVDRPYSFWYINSLNLYNLKKVRIKNYAFDKEYIDIAVNANPKITFRNSKVQSDHYYLGSYTSTVFVDGGTLLGNGYLKPSIPEKDYQSTAEALVSEVNVKNDTLIIGDNEYLNSIWEMTKTTNPKRLKENNKDILKNNITIPDTKMNGNNYSSSYILIYEKYNKSDKIESFTRNDINNTAIHTPVVCQGYISNDKNFNQKIKLTEAPPSLILGRDFTVGINTNGTHRSIKGYGIGNFVQYISDSQVKFPFEIYQGTVRKAANTWISIGNSTKTLNLPIGVKEGTYTLEFRSVSRNVSSMTNGIILSQKYANTEFKKYVATDTLTVNVIGRLYGMSIKDVNTYKVGTKSLNGIESGLSKEFTFPYWCSGFYNQSIPFSINTIGDLNQDTSEINIIPTYYYVDPAAGVREKVDLYTDLSTDKSKREMIKINSHILLNASNRSFIGNTTSKGVSDETRKRTGMQKWESVFSLPEQLFIIPSGSILTDVDKQKEILLGGGYLIVNFNITTKKNLLEDLSYINLKNSRIGYCNMWKTEGFIYEKELQEGIKINLIDGDAIIYKTKMVDGNEYYVIGTH